MGHLSITHEQFVERVKNRNPDVVVLGTFKGITKPVKVKCVVCKHIWEQKAESISCYHPKCKCAHRRKPGLRRTTAQFKKELRNIRTDIQVLGEYVGITKRILVKSLICGHEFSPSADSVRSNRYHTRGCPQCSKIGMNNKGDPKWFSDELKKKHPHLKILGKYINLTTPITVRCKHDESEFEAVPHRVLKLKYGCTECSRLATGYAWKELKLAGKTFKVQGYEPKFLINMFHKMPKLLKEVKYGKDVPRFYYSGKSRNTGKRIEHTYRPDFYIPSKKTIVEVKSTYTAAGTKHMFNTLLKKRMAVVEEGYKFWLVIYDDKGERVLFPSSWFKLSAEELKNAFHD